MSFAQIPTTNSNATASVTAHALALPAGYLPGELLLAFFSSSLASTQTWQTGWQPLYDTVTGGTLAGTAAYRFADGSEGSSVTVTSSVASDGAAITWRVTGAHPTTPPEVGALATGNSTTPSPLGVTASWNQEDNVFVSIAHHDFGAVTQAPTSYGNLQSKDGGATPVIALATRNYTFASDDPDNFVFATADAWIALTLVIRPAIPFSTPIIRPQADVLRRFNMSAGRR